MVKRMAVTSHPMDATTRVMPLKDTCGTLRAIAGAVLAHGADIFEGVACYRCTVAGKPVVVVGDCEYWDVMANREGVV